MSRRNTKAPADDLDDLFEGIDDVPAKKPLKKPVSTASKALKDNDILADIESQLSEVPSRPHTPRLKDKPLVRRGTTDTPPPADVHKSIDNYHASATASETASPVMRASEPEAAPASSGGGWWGFVTAATQTATQTASAAIKAAEQAAKEIQKNDEAMKWAEQVRGNVGALKGFSNELRTRAMPTFTNLIHTLAPPISSHERLLIHITHDFVGYPSLSPLIYGVFSRVMSQVEGGDLLVVQRGSEGGRSSRSEPGWNDGPWWRVVDVDRDMGVIKGLVEGTKLCRINAESFADEFFARYGGLEEARLRATEDLSEENPVRTSNIFLSVQAVCLDTDEDFFAGNSSVKQKGSTTNDEDENEELIQFAIYIHDPVHKITFRTLSQTLPAQWIDWLEAVPVKPTAENETEGVPYEIAAAPEEIRAILETGGADPREWVSEWVEETLNLAIGTVAQRYVAKRMGVGEKEGIRGKRRIEEVLKDGAGEMARANLI